MQLWKPCVPKIASRMAVDTLPSEATATVANYLKQPLEVSGNCPQAYNEWKNPLNQENLLTRNKNSEPLAFSHSLLLPCPPCWPLLHCDRGSILGGCSPDRDLLPGLPAEDCCIPWGGGRPLHFSPPGPQPSPGSSGTEFWPGGERPGGQGLWNSAQGNWLHQDRVWRESSLQALRRHGDLGGQQLRGQLSLYKNSLDHSPARYSPGEPEQNGHLSVTPQKLVSKLPCKGTWI